MTTYTPDSWVIVELFDPSETATGPIFKVLGGWSGGYLDGDSWRLNSGITKVVVDDIGGQDIEFYIHGHSGSVYHVWKNRYGLKMSTAHIAHQITQYGGKILTEAEAMEYLYGKAGR